MRTVRNDFTITHDQKLYLVEEAVVTIKLMVEEDTDGSIATWCRGQKVKFKEIAIRPEKPQRLPSNPRKKAVAPAQD